MAEQEQQQQVGFVDRYPFKCNACKGKGFKTENGINAHRDFMHSGLKHKCTMKKRISGKKLECGDRFEAQIDLISHKKDPH